MSTPYERGGAGELYCSAACYEQGGNAIFAVSMGGQQGRPGRCVTCGAQAMTGEAMALPSRGRIALYCRSCIDSRRAQAQIATIKECAWCGKPVEDGSRKPASSLSQVVVQFRSTDGDLRLWLCEHSGQAGAQGLLPTIQLYGDWCGACRKLRNSFEHPVMKDALVGTYIMQVELDSNKTQLAGLGFRTQVIPVFFLLDETGRPSGPKIDGGAWGDNIPEMMGPPLKAFFGQFRASCGGVRQSDGAVAYII